MIGAAVGAKANGDDKHIGKKVLGAAQPMGGGRVDSQGAARKAALSLPARPYQHATTHAQARG
eukprot:8344542-Lingulodinium_polyedra.AAC.1